MEATGKLTNVKLELLKLFQYNLPDAQLKDILAKYFAKSASDEMDKIWDENKMKTIGMKVQLSHWKNEHLRKRKS